MGRAVYNFLGIEYTYQEVKETELNLGLDLRGGMNVVLEVSPVEIIRSLSGNSKDQNFQKALDLASQRRGDQPGAVYDPLCRSFQRSGSQPAAQRNLCQRRQSGPPQPEFVQRRSN